MKSRSIKNSQILNSILSLGLVAGIFAPSFVCADNHFWPMSKRYLGDLDLTPDPGGDGEDGAPSDGDDKGGKGIAFQMDESQLGQAYAYFAKPPQSPFESLFKLAGFVRVAEPLVIKASACTTYSGIYTLGMLDAGQLEQEFEISLGEPRPNPNRRSAATTAVTFMSNGCPAAASFVKYQDPFLSATGRPNRYRRLASVADLNSSGVIRARRISPFRPDAVDSPAPSMAFLERLEQVDVPGAPPQISSYPAAMNLTVPNSFSVPANYLSGSTIPTFISPSLEVYGGQIYNYRNPSAPFTQTTLTQAFWFTPGSAGIGFTDLSNAQFVHLGVIPPSRSSEYCGEFSFAYGSTETAEGRSVYGFGSLTTASPVPPPQSSGVRSDRCVAGMRRDLAFPSMSSMLNPTEVSVEIVHASNDGRFKLATEYNGSDLAIRSYVVEGSNSRQVPLSGGVNNPRVQAEKIVMTSANQFRVWGHRDLQNPDGYAGSEVVAWNELGNIVTVLGPNIEGRTGVPDNNNFYISSTEVRSATRQGTKDIVVGMARVTDVVENNVQRGTFRAGYSCGVINSDTYPNTFDYEYLPGTPREAFYWETGMNAPKSLKAYALSQLVGDDLQTRNARSALGAMTLCEALDVKSNGTSKVIVGRAISQGRLVGFLLVLNSRRIEQTGELKTVITVDPRI